MAQIFDRSSNALARMSLVLTGLIVIALGVTLDQLQRSPWVTRQGQRAEQPVPFSHKHHVMGLGLQCQYCHTTVEKSSYAGIPPTKTCMNCHSQIWTNAALLEPVRHSWATGESITWTKVHDLPDFVYFNHEIHVNKGIGCSSCHGRVDLMPMMYEAKHAADGVVPELPSRSGQEPSPDLRDLQHGMDRPLDRQSGMVRIGGREDGVPTAQTVNCTNDQSERGRGLTVAALACCLRRRASTSRPGRRRRAPLRCRLRTRPVMRSSPIRHKLGQFLSEQYHIRTPQELSSCETCHR